jgi:UDP-glucose 4-epimerase
MNWLLTGGCGFIGSALARKILPNGHNLRVIDNMSVGTRDDLPLSPVELEIKDCHRAWTTNLSLLVADIRDPKATCAAAAGADIIVHLAANANAMASLKNPRIDCETNVLGTLNMLEAARSVGCRRFVFASSAASLGVHTPPSHEEMTPHPLSPYGASKLAGESYCSAYWYSFGIEAVALRFGNVYGVGSRHKESVIAHFFSRALAGLPLEICGDGNQTRDFIFVDDLIEAIFLAAITQNLGGEVIQIGTGTEHTVNDVARLIQLIVSRGLGNNVVLSTIDIRPGEIRRSAFDISKARRLLGFAPKTSLEDGLTTVLEYFLTLSPHATSANPKIRR